MSIRGILNSPTAKGFMAYNRAAEAAVIVAMLRAADVGYRNFSDTSKDGNPLSIIIEDIIARDSISNI